MGDLESLLLIKVDLVRCALESLMDDDVVLAINIRFLFLQLLYQKAVCFLFSRTHAYTQSLCRLLSLFVDRQSLCFLALCRQFLHFSPCRLFALAHSSLDEPVNGS